MTEVRDPVIKLFGKTISLLPKQRVTVSTKPRKENCERVLDEEDDGQTLPESNITANPLEKSSSHQTSSKSSEAENQSETSISREKTLKKPDKILPCPRCNSTETKFCYYNNYNVNQPRHFCKKCQRYWTAGGLMRSVPVGSGRRKNKISCASQYRHIIVSDCLQAARANGSVLSFGADSQPFCDSIALTPLDHFKLVKISVSGGARREKADDAATSLWNSAENGGNRHPVFHQPVAQNLSCFRGPGPCRFPMPGFPPPPYWGWNVPWIPPPPSSTLGNHLGDIQEKKESFYDGDSKSGVWNPKRLRLDMNEAAKKSSIWSTLGMMNGKNDSMNAGGGLFKAFHPKMQREETYLALQANPAALSRSSKFHESVNEC